MVARASSVPNGGTFVAGAGSISSSGSTLTVNQSTSRGIINWQGFSIGAGGTVMINNGSGATLNRVIGGNLSEINGKLESTGSVFLINPNGVVVGPGGKVITGGSFVASTRDVTNNQFMDGGPLTFSGTSAGTVTNEGKIVSQGGDVVLIGQSVDNTGKIKAKNGTAALAAGNQVVMSSATGPSGIYVAPDASANGSVTNSGRIKAAAAELASAGGNVYALAGNQGGLISATGTKTVDGQVWLTAPEGTVSVTGTIKAKQADGDGGTIIVNGKSVVVGSTANLNASGTNGGTILVGVSAAGGVDKAGSTTIDTGATLQAAQTQPGGTGGYIETSGDDVTIGQATIDGGKDGTWEVDPYDLDIDATAAATIDAALNAGTNVTEETTSSSTTGYGTTASGTGNITISAPLSWTGSGELTLSAYNNIFINATITIGGNGSISLTADYGGTYIGTQKSVIDFAPDGSGDIEFTGTGGALYIDGYQYTLITTLAQLENMTNGDRYALANSIDASGVTGFAPLWESTAWTGTFNGLGNTISNLNISSADAYIGLFGQVGAAGYVSSLNLTGGTITNTSGGDADTAPLVALNEGTVFDDYSNDTVLGGETLVDNDTYTSADMEGAGGLVGVDELLGIIQDSSAAGNVSLTGSGNVGGLVGLVNAYPDGDNNNYINVTGSSASGTVTAGSGSDIGILAGQAANGAISVSSASGTISGDQSNSYIGGLVGWSDDNIEDDSSSVSITETGDNNSVGGLVGYEDSTSPVDGSTATGNISDTGTFEYVGGLVGYVDNGRATGDHASGTVTGGSAGGTGGLIGSGSGTIADSSAYGDVTASGTSEVGGLAGNSYEIDQSFEMGNVSGGSETGGLAGGVHIIYSSYETGNVTGGSETTGLTGGLVGENTDTVTDSYAIGTVSNGRYVGTLVGYDNPNKTDEDTDLTDDYYDSDTANGLSAVGHYVYGEDAPPVAKTTAQLESSLPLGFSTSIWENDGNTTLPYLINDVPTTLPTVGMPTTTQPGNPMVPAPTPTQPGSGTGSGTGSTGPGSGTGTSTGTGGNGNGNGLGHGQGNGGHNNGNGNGGTDNGYGNGGSAAAQALNPVTGTAAIGISGGVKGAGSGLSAGGDNSATPTTLTMTSNAASACAGSKRGGCVMSHGHH
jgi:filamentous hemagglutinin family protein